MEKILNYMVEEGETAWMGATLEANGVNFTLEVKEGQKAALLLYQKGKAEPEAEIPQEQAKRVGNLISWKLKKFPYKKMEYNYSIDGKVQQDPYAKVIRGRKKYGVVTKEHEVRCGFLWKEYDWEGDQPLKIPYEDVIAYQFHVRGFTRDPFSGVAKKVRGTFLGIQEKIPYLKELGINQVKIMPLYDFEEMQKTEEIEKRISHYETKQEEREEKRKLNFWGYCKGNYFAPKESYAASDDPVTEWKDTVKLLHKNGIEVILEFYFPKGTHISMILECLKFWITQYHVDGFHLLGDQGTFNMIAREPVLAHTKLYGCYFPADELYAKEECPSYRNLAECNDGPMIDLRRMLKGNDGVMESFLYRMKRNPEKEAVIQYITNHDGFTLADLVSYEEKHNEENGENNLDGSGQNYSWNCGAEGKSRKKAILDLRIRQMKNAFAMLLLGAATPMILAGDEFGNSQNGNNNPYCLDSPVSWVNWKELRKNQELFSCVKSLISLRKEHKILHMPRQLQGTDTMSCGYPDFSIHSDSAWFCDLGYSRKQIGFMYCGAYANEKENIYIAYNFNWCEQKFALPSLKEHFEWCAVFSTEEKAEKQTQWKLKGEKTFLVPGRTIVVLIGKEQS
ncbi:MAG: Type II secretory pathway, pullulanase PulA and related glycosidase [Lachnospiraceae bacterium]|nr:Type II secretory pathway, pullulanase PulA and related glycosidase [Lachnospiraceae bacterium]